MDTGDEEISVELSTTKLTGIDQVSVAPVPTRRAWWIVAGAVLAIVGMGLPLGIARLEVMVPMLWAPLLWWGVGLAIFAGIFIAVAPAAKRQKAMSVAWLAAFVISAIISAFMWQEQVFVTILGYVVAVACAVGWWITLRGRVGWTYLALVLAPVMTFLVLGTRLAHHFLFISFGTIFAFDTWAITYVQESLMEENSLNWIANRPFLYQAAPMLVVAVIAITWVAAIPALNRVAIARHDAGIARREARRPVPIVGSTDPASGVSAASVEQTNPLAIAALITGLVGMNVVPIVLGHVARGQIRRTGQRGNGMALAGLILGYVSAGIVVVLAGIIIIFATLWA